MDKFSENLKANLNLGLLIDPVTRFRNYLFDHEFLLSTQISCKVISVGNITMGGTGKTPMTSFLYKYFRGFAKSKKIGIIVRSYKTPLDHPIEIDIDSANADLVGDEALLLKMKCPDAIVVSGPSKRESALFLINKVPDLDVLIIDDGFQHRKLKRNLDIVLLDASVSPQEYTWPLNGRLRESINSLNRAQVVILTKMESQNSETLSYILSKIPSQDIVILESFQKEGEIYQVAGSKFSNEMKSGSFAFCGIAKPENFKMSLEKKQIPIDLFLSFPDHHFYTEKEVNEVLIQNAKKFACAISTEKDFMRLKKYWPKEGPALFVLPIDIELRGQLERFYELLNT